MPKNCLVISFLRICCKGVLGLVVKFLAANPDRRFREAAEVMLCRKQCNIYYLPGHFSYAFTPKSLACNAYVDLEYKV